MKLKLLVLLFLNFNLFSQEDLTTLNKKTIDETINTLYSVISGDKGVERDWDLFKSLFHPDAKLIPSGPSQDGNFQAIYLSPDDYIKYQVGRSKPSSVVLNSRGRSPVSGS